MSLHHLHNITEKRPSSKLSETNY